MAALFWKVEESLGGGISRKETSCRRMTFWVVSWLVTLLTQRCKQAMFCFQAAMNSVPPSLTSFTEPSKTMSQKKSTPYLISLSYFTLVTEQYGLHAVVDLLAIAWASSSSWRCFQKTPGSLCSLLKMSPAISWGSEAHQDNPALPLLLPRPS